MQVVYIAALFFHAARMPNIMLPPPEPGGGTEVELTVPASVAYESHAGRRLRFSKS